MEAFEQSVRLNVDRAQFVRTHLNFKGVNAELGPYVHMTSPPEWRTRSLTLAPVGVKLFNSIVLLFGFIPVDLHRILLREVGRNGFMETSDSLIMRQWHHYREVREEKGGCVVSDKVVFTTRLPFMDRFLKPIYHYIFRHRHAKLASRFNP